MLSAAALPEADFSSGTEADSLETPFVIDWCDGVDFQFFIKAQVTFGIKFACDLITAAESKYPDHLVIIVVGLQEFLPEFAGGSPGVPAVAVNHSDDIPLAALNKIEEAVDPFVVVRKDDVEDFCPFLLAFYLNFRGSHFFYPLSETKILPG